MAGGARPDSRATLVERPYAYLFPATLTKVVDKLQHHGIVVEELREDIELDVEVYRVDKIARDASAFQKHRLVSTETGARKETRKVEAGTILVRTGQKLGTLAAYLLEPQAEDGLCAWNFFDDLLAEGQDFPVLRLPAPAPLTGGRVRPLPENRTMNKPITFDAVYASTPPLSFAGRPAAVRDWLEDGEHFLQVKEGKLYKVHALTGRCQPFYDSETFAKGLQSLPTFDKEKAKALARGTSAPIRRRAAPMEQELQMNPQKTGAVVEHGNDLYYCNFDGTHAIRLTKTPGKKEFVTFSPDGKFVGFILNQNLYVVDVATATMRQLTTDGSPLVGNGKPDWVYAEEIFLYHKAYWWSPDSARIAFVRFDDAPVHKFTVIDEVSGRQIVESTSYPRSGDANPLVKLGVVAVAGGPVAWADLSNYSESSSLMVGAGWMPDSQSVYFYVQDRAQTWLDFCKCNQGGTTARLFRETTKAWVDEPGAPAFLKDGSFVFASERTGWKHLYHYDKSGKLLGALTSGAWEVQALQGVDEKEGWIYFTARCANPIATDLYRARLVGGSMQRLTLSPGDHRVQLSPKHNLFVDAHSDYRHPEQVRLCRADGTPARMIDTNPVYAIEEYRFGQEEKVQIKTPDGFVLEGSVLKPPDFDPQRRYPVWFMTYGGPHAPTIHDTWAGGRVRDQVLAQLGFIVFRCDPRSASGKGACSTWTAFHRLGVQELKDIESAVNWIKQYPFVDGARIGMSGHSYGGFMTAYALTHSKLFAAGVAGAPVTDWRNYDSIYTERYMNTPQENPEGYNLTSVVKAAKDLHGKLLIVHGIMDDNVHMQNTAQL
ncbi:MAG: S9 family peptidase, partial [Planctomycetota bacterium]